MLLDREAELDLAAAALQAGCGALILVTGPLGVGKSALLDGIGALGEAQRARQLRVSAAPMERGFPLGVARQLLEPALRDASHAAAERWTTGPARAARTALDSGWPGGEEAQRAVLHGLTALVENMGRDQPLLMLVDELQWADRATLRWLRHLGERLAALPVVLVCAVREGDTLAGDPDVQQVIGHATETLRPGNLPLDGSAGLARQHFGEAADEAFVHACHEATGGNPLFLGSVLADAASQGLRPTPEHARAAAGLRPAPLQRQLLLRLDAQSEPVRKLARAVAVLGTEATPELLSRLTGLDAAVRDQALRHLTALGLTTGMRCPRFVRRLVQEVVEEGVPPTERTALHALAAELLHRTGRPPERVARHLMVLTAPTWPWATEVLRAAARSAQRRGAPEVAAGFLRRALLDGPPDAERAQLLVDLATAERSFAPYAAVRHIAQAALLLDEPEQRAKALVRLAPTSFASTLLPVQELLREVADALGPEERLWGPDRELALRLEARLRHSSLPEPDELADSVNRLLHKGPEPRMDTVGERELLAPLLAAATFANALPAHKVAPMANRLLESEPALATHVHTTAPLVVASLVAADSLDSLGAWLDRVEQTATGRQTRMEQALVGTEQALVSLASGRLAEAKERALAAYELGGAKNEEVFTVSSMTLAMVSIPTGDDALAQRLLAGTSRAADDPYVWSVLSMLKGQCAARKGDLELGLSHFLNAGRRLEQCGWLNPALLPWASAAALVHFYLGNQEQAAELSSLEVERARVWGAPGSLGRSLRAHAQVLGGPEGTEVLQEAVDVLQGSNNRFELCQALLELGERHGPDDPRGREALLGARAEAVACDLPWLVRRAEERLAEATTPGPTGSQLTPAERKVAELAASGLTNKKIAEFLNITCRAVEKHLTNCYRKMSIRGRMVLADSLRELDRSTDFPGAAASG
ncbi:AAA family ATPase [Streptomyces sp. NPDC056411]|uniref:helix-turn-helix transcriptional regulator n=1 Tax=Streptomyces sp. NPDC056411 TaxID=3345813 RepID=UPI0035D8DAD9